MDSERGGVFPSDDEEAEMSDEVLREFERIEKEILAGVEFEYFYSVDKNGNIVKVRFDEEKKSGQKFDSGSVQAFLEE